MEWVLSGLAVSVGHVAKPTPSSQETHLEGEKLHGSWGLGLWHGHRAPWQEEISYPEGSVVLAEGPEY